MLKTENLCQKYINLFSNFNNKIIKPSTKYIFESKKLSEENYKKIINKINYKKYLLIHFDEKWIDINSINDRLINSIESFQKNSNIKIILTAYNNKFHYYEKLKDHFDYIDFSNVSNLSNMINYNQSKIIILDNLEIFLFEQFIKNSVANISCHSGFMAQVAGASNSPVIDIIKQKDFIWYDCWKPRNTIHHFVSKSQHNNKIHLDEIFMKISKIVHSINS